DRRKAARGIGPGEAHCRHAGGVQGRHEPRVDEARQHRDHDVERRLVRDAQAVDLPFFKPGDFQRGVDFLAAAVHDDDRRSGGQPLYRGDDCRQVRAILEELAAKFQYEGSGNRHSKPTLSSMPSMTFMFCTAWPDAPFSRLSMTETRMTRPPASTRQPMSQK